MCKRDTVGGGPTPAAGGARAPASPAVPLPPAQPAPPEQVAAFFVELRDGPTCAIRTGPEPVIVGGAAATLDCDTPYTFLTTIAQSGPTWRASTDTPDPTPTTDAAGGEKSGRGRPPLFAHPRVEETAISPAG